MYGVTKVTKSLGAAKAKMVFGSHSEQVGMEFGVSVFLRPEVERDGGKIVDEGLGEPVLGEVDGLDVGLAGVAALDADVGEGIGGVNRNVWHGLAGRIPGQTRRRNSHSARQKPQNRLRAAIALLAENAEPGLAIAERAQGMGVAVKLQVSVRTLEFRVGLQEGEG
ncbi:MAG: hypothetical protein WCA20_34600 [Candidatus Sulfotelmatobacter sp.]